MKQDDVFEKSEGDQWFRRNQKVLDAKIKVDWPTEIVKKLDLKNVRSILDLGCSNGWRLENLSKVFTDARCVGVDVSSEAIEAGQKAYPGFKFLKGSLAEIPVKEEFDLVIVNSVFHWVDRQTLSKSIAEVDRVTKDGGVLVIGDFWPDFPQRRDYHHVKDHKMFTYKQDYPQIFEALGTYKTLVRTAYDSSVVEMNNDTYKARLSNSDNRAYCVALVKSLNQFYVDVK